MRLDDSHATDDSDLKEGGEMARCGREEVGAVDDSSRTIAVPQVVFPACWNDSGTHQVVEQDEGCKENVHRVHAQCDVVLRQVPAMHPHGPHTTPHHTTRIYIT
jgi:hypothetical protein